MSYKLKGGFDRWWILESEEIDEELLKKYCRKCWIAALQWTIEQKVCGWEKDGSITTSNMIKVSDIEQELKELNDE